MLAMTDSLKFNESTTMSFRANKKHLLKNYNKIWEKVEMLLQILKANLFMVMAINT